MTDYYKCKWCEYKVKKWITNKKGKAVNLYSQLEAHVMLEHEEDYLAIIDILDLEIRDVEDLR